MTTQIDIELHLWRRIIELAEQMARARGGTLAAAIPQAAETVAAEAAGGAINDGA